MSKKRIETGKMPQISVVECNSDLVIRSWSETAVLITGDNYEANEDETGLSITSQGRLKLMVPTETSLSTAQVSGDLVIKNVTGDASLGEVSGDAVLVGLGYVKINTVHGDLSAKNFEGGISAGSIHGDALVRNVNNLTADAIYGDLSARNINGIVQVNEVMGDIGLRAVAGDVTIEKGHRDANVRHLSGTTTLPDIRGDIRIHGGLSEGEHTFVAGGDIILRWPENAAINLTATATTITNKLDLDEVAQKGDLFTGRIGDSQVSVSLSAKGRVILKDVRIVEEKWGWEPFDTMDFDSLTVELEGLGTHISTQVNEHVARLTTELEGKFGAEYSQKIADKIARQAERAAIKAEKAAERALRRAERSMKRSGWHGRPRRPTPPPAPKKKATSEEQLKILKMVEQGIISTDEASTLLQALEN